MGAFVESIKADDLDNAKQSGIVLVDFWMDKCGFCDKLSPKLEAFALEHPEVKVLKLNKKDAEDLCEKLNITIFPTLFLYKDGEFVKHCTGNRSEEQLKDFVFGDYGIKGEPKKKSMPEQKTIQVPVNLLQAIADYLITKPYREVSVIVDELKKIGRQ